MSSFIYSKKVEGQSIRLTPKVVYLWLFIDKVDIRFVFVVVSCVQLKKPIEKLTNTVFENSTNGTLITWTTGHLIFHAKWHNFAYKIDLFLVSFNSIPLKSNLYFILWRLKQKETQNFKWK